MNIYIYIYIYNPYKQVVMYRTLVTNQLTNYFLSFMDTLLVQRSHGYQLSPQKVAICPDEWLRRFRMFQEMVLHAFLLSQMFAFQLLYVFFHTSPDFSEVSGSAPSSCFPTNACGKKHQKPEVLQTMVDRINLKKRPPIKLAG